MLLTPGVLPVWIPGAWLAGFNYVGGHLTFFFSFPHYKSMGAIDLQVVASLNPTDLIGRIM